VKDRTYADAAEELNIPESWLKAQAQARQIPHHRYGRWVRFTDGDLDAIRAKFAEPELNLAKVSPLRGVA